VRKATRLSGTFAVLTGGSNDDLQRKVACAAPRARNPNTFRLCAYTGFGGGAFRPKTEIRSTYLAIITFLDLY
jgi:hypothetical protein